MVIFHRSAGGFELMHTVWLPLLWQWSDNF